VLLGLEIPATLSKATTARFRIPLLLLLCAIPGLSQEAHQDDGSQYDLHTEMKTKGVVDEAELLPLGTRKGFTELIIKSGHDKVHIYAWPEPFQKEISISFSKGDEIAVTGSKVEQESSDVILARELVRVRTHFCSATTKATRCGIGARASDSKV
jgi:hypothetical protein